MPKQAPSINKNKEFLREILENYSWCIEEWAPIHKEGNIDVRFIAGDPWNPQDINAREALDQKRPHLVFDEGSQYVNMFTGQAMQQKRSVKVDPIVEDVDADTAEKLQGRLMHIEYASRGQTHCLKALRDCAIRGYGWISLRKRYSGDKTRLQEPCYMPVPNPDSRLMDPAAKEPDGSDADFVFVRDTVKKSYVKRKFPWAKELGKTEGTDNVKTVVLVEYWKSEKEDEDTIYLLNTDDGEKEVKKSELNGGTPDESRVLDSRDTHRRKVTKYLCQMIDPSIPAYKANDASPEDAVEVLEVEEWDGKYIPEIPVFGPAEYIEYGGTTHKVLLSMLRRARDPMGLLNLTRTAEAELMAMTPKTRFMGYEGQFERHEAEFENIGTNPIAYLQVKPVIDQTAGQVLPLPTQITWEPPIQALEMLATSCQNAIRSAIGQLASPELDKTKSGIALDKIRQGGESAVYHIIDAYEASLEQVGRVVGDLCEATHDCDRTDAIRTPTGDQRMVRFNAPHTDENGKTQQFNIAKDGFSYTLSVGPSYQSQFQQASEFVDTLVTQMPNLLMDGGGRTFLGDLVVQIKNLGPIGDEMVKRFKAKLDPALQDQNIDIPPQIQAQMAQAQQVINLLTGKVNALHDVIDKKSVEQQGDLQRAEMDNKTKIAIAEINASVKENVIQLQAQMDAIAAHLNHQFDMIKTGMDQQFQAQQATQQQQAVAQQQNAVAQQQPAGQGGGLQATHAFNPQTQEIQPIGQGGPTPAGQPATA